ncbi:MAG: chloride channel protein [Halanaeroarchaeum sp.]
MASSARACCWLARRSNAPTHCSSGGSTLLLGSYNLYRSYAGELEHPDVLRGAAILGLWLLVYTLALDETAVSLLSKASLGLGALVVAVNVTDFAVRFKNRPGKRTWARTHGPSIRSTGRAATLFGYRKSATLGGHLRRTVRGDGFRLNLIAIVVGVIAGIGAVVFRITIWSVQEVFFGTSLNPGSVGFPSVDVPTVFGLTAFLGPARYLLVPALGGLLVGFVVKSTTSAVRGHGVPEVLEGLMTENGRIDPRITVYKIAASSLAIGSGASLGREGPIVQIGSAAGSYFGKFVDSRYTRTLVAAGGGIAATFNTPIADVMFALEILLAEFHLQNVIVVVLSAVTATAVARTILGFTATPGLQEFLVPVHYQLVTPAVEFPLYILLGVVVAVVGAAVVKILYATDFFFRELDMPDYVKPAIGGLLLGASVLLTATVLQIPVIDSAGHLFGVGYGTIHASIAGQLTLGVLVVLALMKTIGFSMSVGSGSSGGVFSPSLFVGAAVGGAFGVIVHSVVPGTAGPGTYALVGTAGVFAAAASAPLTATLIIFELTGQYTIMLPLLVVTVIGSEVGQFLLEGGTIYTEKLRHKGMTVQERRIGSLEDLTAKDVMTADIDTVRTGTPIADAVDVFRRTSHRGLPIVDEDGIIAGILVRSDLEDILAIPDERGDDTLLPNGGQLRIEPEARDGDVAPDTPVEALGVTEVVTASKHTNLLTLVDRMANADVGRVPIVDERGRVEGIVTRTDVLAAYDRLPMGMVESGHRGPFGPVA